MQNQRACVLVTSLYRCVHVYIRVNILTRRDIQHTRIYACVRGHMLYMSVYHPSRHGNSRKTPSFLEMKSGKPVAKLLLHQEQPSQFNGIGIIQLGLFLIMPLE